MSNTKQTCDTCENGIFCPTWAEVKCMVFLRRNVYEPDQPNDCEKYKKKKSVEEPTCNCDECCESRSLEDTE